MYRFYGNDALNEETLLRKQMFPSLRPQETFVVEAKLFVNLFRKILLLQQMFPRLRAEENFGKQRFRTQRFLGFREPLDDFSESNRSHLLT